MSYFRNLSGNTQNSFDFAEDLGNAVDRAQGVLHLVVDSLVDNNNKTVFFALHSALRELSDMGRSIDVFIDAHPDNAGNITKDAETVEGAE